MGSVVKPTTLARPSSSTRRSILQDLLSASPPSSLTEQPQQLLEGAGQAAPACSKRVDQQLHYYNYWAITPFGINASSSFVYKPRVNDQSREHLSTNVDSAVPMRTMPHPVHQCAPEIAPALASRSTVHQNAISAPKAMETQALENQSPLMPPVSGIDSFIDRMGESDHTDDVTHAYHVNQKLQKIHRCMLDSLRDQSNIPTATTAQIDLKDVAFLAHQHEEELQQVLDQSMPHQVSMEARAIENAIKGMPSVLSPPDKILDLESNAKIQVIGLESCRPATSACSSSSSSSVSEIKQQSTMPKMSSDVMDKITEESLYEPSDISRKDSNSIQKCMEESKSKTSSNTSSMETKKDIEGGLYSSGMSMSKADDNSKKKFGLEERKDIEPLGHFQEILEENDESNRQQISSFNNIEQAAGLALDMLTDQVMYCSACTSTGPCALHGGLCSVSYMSYMHANLITGDVMKEPCFLYQYDYTVQPDCEQHVGSLPQCMQAQDTEVVQAPLFISGSPLPFADHDLLVNGDPLDEQTLHIWDY